MRRFSGHRQPQMRFSRWPGRLLVFVPLAFAACRALPAVPARPAIIAPITAASRADLERAVSLAFGGAPVRLADDALTHNSLLLLGRAQARDARGLPLNGRDLEHPQHFRLFKRGSQCVLLHVETDKSSVLVHTHCQVLPSGHTVAHRT